MNEKPTLISDVVHPTDAEHRAMQDMFFYEHMNAMESDMETSKWSRWLARGIRDVIGSVAAAFGLMMVVATLHRLPASNSWSDFAALAGGILVSVTALRTIGREGDDA